MKIKLPGARRLLKCLPALALLAGMSDTALAAQYTAQEKANMQLVSDYFNALDAADAKGNTKTAIVEIANKYVAPGYINHAGGGANGRDNLIKWFQGRSSAVPKFEPPKLVTIMAEGDLVVRITSRGSNMIWNMFRVEKGQLAEHWDAGAVPPGGGAGGPPAGGPSK